MASSSRYVLLLHKNPGPGREDHWDLMLEHDNALVTFELPVGCFSSADRALTDDYRLQESTFHVQRLSDHRIAYLTYEGEVSNNRGSVTQVDSGTYVSTPEVCDFDNRGPQQDAIIRLTGLSFSGNLRLFFASQARNQLLGQWLGAEPTADNGR